MHDLIGLGHGGVDLLQAGGLLEGMLGDRRHRVVQVGDLQGDALERGASVADEFDAARDLRVGGRNQGLDLLGRVGRALRERAHFGRHDREASAGFPARAASTPALSASKLVWNAISSITPMIWPICLDELLDSLIASIASRTTTPLFSASTFASRRCRARHRRPAAFSRTVIGDAVERRSGFGEQSRWRWLWSLSSRVEATISPAPSSMVCETENTRVMSSRKPLTES